MQLEHRTVSAFSVHSELIIIFRTLRSSESYAFFATRYLMNVDNGALSFLYKKPRRSQRLYYRQRSFHCSVR